MKTFVYVAALIGMSLPVLAYASCDTVKSSIDTKLKAKGVSHYRLDVVATGQANQPGGTVVGHCEGDKVIVYSHKEAAPDERKSDP